MLSTFDHEHHTECSPFIKKTALEGSRLASIVLFSNETIKVSIFKCSPEPFSVKGLSTKLNMFHNNFDDFKEVEIENISLIIWEFSKVSTQKSGKRYPIFKHSAWNPHSLWFDVASTTALVDDFKHYSNSRCLCSIIDPSVRPTRREIFSSADRVEGHWLA